MFAVMTVVAIVMLNPALPEPAGGAGSAQFHNRLRRGDRDHPRRVDHGRFRVRQAAVPRQHLRRADRDRP
jgi:hypothetical protein